MLFRSWQQIFTADIHSSHKQKLVTANTSSRHWQQTLVTDTNRMRSLAITTNENGRHTNLIAQQMIGAVQLINRLFGHISHAASARPYLRYKSGKIFHLYIKQNMVVSERTVLLKLCDRRQLLNQFVPIE